MTEFYPGSSRRKKSYDEEPVPVVEELPDLILGKPRLYLINGKPVEFYSLGDVARNLNRSPVTIRKMEANGQLPISPFVSPGIDERGKRRLYIKEQIESLRQIAQEEGILYPSSGGKWKAIEQTQFTKKAQEMFKTLRV